MKDSWGMGTCGETGRRGLWGTRGEWMRIWGVGMRGVRGCADRKLVWWGMKVWCIGEWKGEWGSCARIVACRWQRKGALVCHRRTCGAGRRLEDGRRECGECGARVSYANFACHVRSCRAGGRGAAAVGDGGGGVVGGERTMGMGWGRGRGTVGGCWARTGFVGGGGTVVGVWVGGLVVSFAEGNWPWETWRGTSASPAWCGIRGAGDRGQRSVARGGRYGRSPCATFRLHGARGGEGTPGWRVENTALYPCRGNENVGRRWRNRVSSPDEALEEAAVESVGEGGGRPGPHPKPNKG